MSYLWFFLGVIVGQGLVVFAAYLGEVFKDRREALEENELHRSYASDAVKELEEVRRIHLEELERFENELHRTR